MFRTTFIQQISSHADQIFTHEYFDMRLTF